ncbi:MAG TPA: DUF378 domain-containing protein [Candidatus Saccharimonadales bacterium]|nr:DUF378 domain-containing protein [Candidatus Saccharimonadales bacterium]
MNIVDKIAMWVLIIGGLNWGAVGLFDYNLVEKLFGVDSNWTKAVYIVVGIAALLGISAMITGFSSRRESYQRTAHNG